MATVLQTDFAWPDVTIERGVIEGAGHTLVTGPSEPSPAAAVEAMVAEHDPAAILTCWADISAAAIRAPSALKIVQRLGVGLDNIAMEAATARGAWVANVPDYCVEEVSDHAVALAYAWFRGIAHFDRAVKAGQWDPSGARLRRGATLTAGILGLGRIGRCTARKLAALGMTVLGHDIAAPCRRPCRCAWSGSTGWLPRPTSSSFTCRSPTRRIIWWMRPSSLSSSRAPSSST